MAQEVIIVNKDTPTKVVEKYIMEGRDIVIDTEYSLSTWFDAYMESHPELKRNTIIDRVKEIGLKSVYDILNGNRKNPSKYAIIVTCLAMGMDINGIKKALNLCGYSIYPKEDYDSVLYCALMKDDHSLKAVDNYLKDHGKPGFKEKIEKKTNNETDIDEPLPKEISIEGCKLPFEEALLKDVQTDGNNAYLMRKKDVESKSRIFEEWIKIEGDSKDYFVKAINTDLAKSRDYGHITVKLKENLPKRSLKRATIYKNLVLASDKSAYLAFLICYRQK